ncbi:MAG TPA: cytochrome c oxidase assembly factor Coa1 family protein [Thermoanaerobaculia bacterium]|nr:cytochrome c oxidase assembly factor Coa1 family protein [Thermoanaerobaculia bacterium]
MNGDPLAPPKRGTSPWVWVGCGCGAVIVAGIAFVAFIVFVVFAAMRSADPYKDGLERARGDARVQQALGTPIEPGWFLSGNIKTENNSGDCDIVIPLHGPKQKGSVRVVGTKDGGHWTYTKMLVTPASGPPIDLLGGYER